MILFVVHVLAKFVQHPIYVPFFASEKVPAGPGVKFLCIFFQAGRRVDLRVNADRNDVNILANMIAQGLLQFLKIAIHRQTASLASCEERVDDHHLVLEQIAVEAHPLTVLIYQYDIGEILVSRRFTRGLR